MADPVKTPIEPSLIARITGAFKVLTGQQSTTYANAWLSPLNPIEVPVLTPEQQVSVIGRQMDYPVGYNLRTKPRGDEPVSFDQMRALSNNCDILRTVIETRKDQISKMKFKILPVGKDKPDARSEEVMEFFKKPDGENSWDEWLRQIVEEMLVTDAATIYPWMTNGNTPYRFELVDGSTIKRVINPRGRTPAPPEIAYQQVLKGLPTVNYTTDELIYLPRNKRVNKIYGYSPVEQIILTINIAIRRSVHQLQFYTEGSKPDLLFQCPPDWQMAQIKEFSDWWQDSLSGNTATRRKAQFLPNGVTPIDTKAGILKDDYDEWLARIICYAFSVSPTAFTKQQNRATSETAREQALEEGLYPVMQWVKGFMDDLIQVKWNMPDHEFLWQDESSIDPNVQSQIDDRAVKNGTKTINEIRAERGDAPLKDGDEPMVLTATGYVPIKPAEPEPEVLPNETPPAENEGSTPAGEQKSSVKDTTKIAKAANIKQSDIKRIDTESVARLTAEKKLAKGIRAIFKKQVAVIKAKLTKIEIDMLDDIDWSPMNEFEDLFGKQLVFSAKLGGNEAYAQLNLDDPDMLNLANDFAVDYAANRSAYLVGKKIDADGNLIANPDSTYAINDATREMLQVDVMQAVNEGLSNQELADGLANSYAFSDERAMSIARTETSFAANNGNLDMYKNSGVVDQKEWLTGADCCDDCAEIDEEIVDLDDEFSNGDDVPPDHPNCRCCIAPILAPETED